MDKKNDTPLVSIVITNYNYDKYLKKAINSALAQTYKNIEIIIIDDYSSDSSKDILDKYSSFNNIRVIYHKKNKGIVYSRNEALRVSNGIYLSMLDADDFMEETYIQDMVSIALETNSDVIYPNWHLIDLTTKKEYYTNFPEFSLKELQLQKINISPVSLVKLETAKKYKFTNEVIAEDWDYFLELAINGAKFKLAKNVFANYVVGKESRGNSNNYEKAVSDMKQFVKILFKYKKQYPKYPIIDPMELVIYKYGDIVAINNNTNTTLTNTEAENEKLRLHRDKIEAELNSIYYSTEYKMIIKPILRVKKFLKKKFF